MLLSQHNEQTQQKFRHKKILSNSLWKKKLEVEKWPIFTKTKYGILMTIVTSAVLAFYADSKYIKFFQFIVTKKPKIGENEPDFWKKMGNTPKKASDLFDNLFIRYIISENLTIEVSSSNLHSVDLRFFFSEEISSMHVYLFCIFPRGDCIKPKVRDNREGAH